MYSFLGLQRPTSGAVTLFGKTPELGSDAFAHVAYLPEEPHYHTYLTVEEAIAFYGRLYGRKVPAPRLNEVLDRFGLGEFRALRIEKCSKGMKQKMGIAACLVADPRLLLLDEPTRGLDPIVVKEVREALVELNRGGTTIVLNSHVLSEIETVANRVAIVKRGKVVREDLLRNLLQVDRESYAVELECDASNNVEYPEYWKGGERVDGVVRGRVPAAHLEEFVRFVSRSGCRLSACALERKTLEESFFAIVKEEDHAQRATAG